ncbi:colanic acid/amylovoran biosynthesis protein [Salinibacter ruber]|uniref:polysaccharide pyruvyl transferase family protein n=1 Tax=Salinibacter ruber TaxID=146919 RepID=UPI002167BA3F|nr:polysaccharide pyruvyl transferase family protein [Salinibacter ruber]MCS3626923.1 colanic acid/amylovoran biosynthesis protein [Salinibacter ruber]MCS4143825.1 colanic acid/amylovoran biosynthesis protein [Salinibacter ruber]
MSVKVVVSNTVALNGGDAAILLALRHVLKKHLGDRLDLTVFDSQPEVASRLYPELDFRQLLYENTTWRPELNDIDNRYVRYLLRETSKIANPFRVWLALYLWKEVEEEAARLFLTSNEWESLQIYASADVIISTGGTYLVDYYFLEPRIFDYQIAHFFDRPLVFYTQTAGPFETPRYRRALRSIMNRAQLILLRDEESADNLRDIGVTDTPLVVAADAVFSLAEPDDLEAARDRTYPLEDRPRVAVSVRHWPHFQNRSTEEGMRKYRESIQSAVHHLAEHHNAKIKFVSTCQGVQEYRNDDAQVAQRIADCLPDEIRSAVTVDASFHAPTDLKEEIKSYDFVVATRMHMAILGLVAGTPVLPIAYEPKTTHLFRKMGLGEWVTSIETIDPSFSDKVDQFIEQIDSLRNLMIDGADKERQQADLAAQQLGEVFRKIGVESESSTSKQA